MGSVGECLDLRDGLERSRRKNTMSEHFEGGIVMCCGAARRCLGGGRGGGNNDESTWLLFGVIGSRYS